MVIHAHRGGGYLGYHGHQSRAEPEVGPMSSSSWPSLSSTRCSCVVQEAKSEQALEALQQMSAAQSKVIRDGKLVHLPSSELVPGDIVVLEAGDSVPARLPRARRAPA